MNAKRKKAKSEDRTRFSNQHIAFTLAAIIIVLIVFLPNIGLAIGVASHTSFAPSDGWMESLNWLKQNSPDTRDYQVMAWWDYGYWIDRIAGRTPIANPGQGPVVATVADFFVSSDKNIASEIAEETKSAYVVIDSQTVSDKLYAVIESAGKKPEDFFETYYLSQGNYWQPINFFYPEFYQSTAVRLYNFDGKAVSTSRPLVISYREMVNLQGNSFKGITDVQTFPNYEAAVTYVSTQNSTTCKIVGVNPFISPVPLDELEQYKLIYTSKQMVENSNLIVVTLKGNTILSNYTNQTPGVKIFSVIRKGQP